MDPNIYVGYAKVNDKNGNPYGVMLKLDGPKDAQDFISIQRKSVAPYNSFKALFIPTRTDNVKDFAKDLLFPTFFNQALRVNNMALRVLAALVAIPLDLITLLPRLCIAPFKYLYDSKQKPKPFNPHSDDYRSLMHIEIVQQAKSKINPQDPTRCITVTQTIHYWVRTKALPEDKKKLPKAQIDYTLGHYCFGPKGWELEKTEKESVKCNSLSALKKELEKFQGETIINSKPSKWKRGI